MAEEIRVGVAGLTHGHVWGLIDAWKEVEGAKLVAVADGTPLLEKAASSFESRYTDYREMLANENLDVLVVTSDNVESAQITVEALDKGIHCMVEKAMAANAKDADRMLEAMRRSGKTLMINWPIASQSWPYDLRTKIEEGAIGKVFNFHFLFGHHGPKEIGCDEWFVGWLYDEAKNGGGAIADFCSYGAALCVWIFGMPESVYCVKGNYTKDYSISDDHAICVLKYGDRNCVIEGTWATYGFPSGPNPVAFGKSGTLGVEKGSLVKFAVGEQPVTFDQVPLKFPNPAEYFLDCIRNGKSPEGIRNPEIAANACRILDAATASARSGCAERP